MPKTDSRSSIKSLLSKAGVLVIFAASLLYFLTDLSATVGFYDEAIPTYGAERILNGDIPYRDFWTIYPPAQFYTLAFLFKIFGSSILVERVYDAILRSLISTLVFLFAVRMASLGWGLVVWLVVVVWLKYLGSYAYPNIPAVFLALVGLYLLSSFLHNNRSRTRLFLAGIIAGVVGLFRHDTGFYLLLSGLLVVFLFSGIGFFPKKGGENFLRGVTKPTFLAFTYLAGVALPIVPALIYFLRVAPIRTLIADLIIFPMKVFPSVRSSPFPKPLPDVLPVFRGEEAPFLFLAKLSEKWLFYSTFLVLFVALFSFVSDWLRSFRGGLKSPTTPIWNRDPALFLIFGLVSLHNLRVRPDIAHLLPSFVSVAVLTATLGSHFYKTAKARKGWLVIAVLLAGGLLLANPLSRWLNPEMPKEYRALVRVHDLERARGVGVFPNQVEAIHYVRSLCFPSERIFVGNRRHDLIYANDIMFYFLSGLPCATRYHELFPGVATSRAVQMEIVEELKRNRVRYLVLTLPFPNFKGREVTNDSVPVRVLDNYITQNYQLDRQYGFWLVWKKK